MLFDTNRRWITPTWYSFARIRLCTLPIIELDHLIRLENVTNRRASRARNAETTSCDWLADRQSGPLIWQTHQSDSSHDFVKPRIECFAIIIINLWCKVCVRLHGSPPPCHCISTRAQIRSCACIRINIGPASFSVGDGISRELINSNEFHANILVSLEMELSTNIEWLEKNHEELCWRWCWAWHYPSRMFCRIWHRMFFLQNLYWCTQRTIGSISSKSKIYVCRCYYSFAWIAVQLAIRYWSIKLERLRASGWFFQLTRSHRMLDRLSRKCRWIEQTTTANRIRMR